MQLQFQYAYNVNVDCTHWPPNIVFFIRKLCYKDVEIIFTQSVSVIKKENGKKTNFYKTPDLI